MKAFVALIASLLLSSTVPAQDRPEIRIGIFDTFGPEFWPRVLGPSLEYWRKSLPQYHITTQELSAGDVEHLDEIGLSFFISSPFLYWSSHMRRGASAVAALTPATANDSAHAAAGVVVVRSDSSIKSLTDFKTHPVRLAVATSGLNAELIAVKGALTDLGLSPDKVLREVRPVGLRTPGVISAVAAGAADAGIMQLCDLENAIHHHAIPRDALQVLDNKATEQESCLRSTNRYPDVVFAALATTPARVVTDFAAVAYAMPATSKEQWLSASNFTEVDRLSRQLALGSYAYLQEWTPQALWKRFSTEILLAGALIFAIGWHLVRVNELVLRRTRELRQAIEEMKLLAQRDRQSREQLATFERTSLVSQLSSLIAHELKQPLGAIANYSAGLGYHLKLDSPDLAMIADIVQKIRAQALQAADTIEYVRSYAKKNATPHPLMKTNLRKVAQQAACTFELNFRGRCRLENRITLDAIVLADNKGLELTIYNLLKNGADAAQKSADPLIVLTLSENERSWTLGITDNGPALTDEALSRMQKPLASLKAEGLGLGLLLVRQILERNRGQLTYRRELPQGLTALITLPKTHSDTLP